MEMLNLKTKLLIGLGLGLMLLLVLIGCEKEIEIPTAELYIKLSNGSNLDSNIEVSGLNTPQVTSRTKYGNWAKFTISQEDNITIRYCFDDTRFYEETTMFKSETFLRTDKVLTCTNQVNNLQILSNKKIVDGTQNMTITISPEDGILNDLTICETHTASLTNIKIEQLQPHCRTGWDNCKKYSGKRCLENYTAPRFKCDNEFQNCKEIIGNYCILTLPSNLPSDNCIRFGNNIEKENTFSFKLFYESYYTEDDDYITIHAIDKEGRVFQEDIRWEV